MINNMRSLFAVLIFSLFMVTSYPVFAQTSTATQPLAPEIQALQSQIDDIREELARLTKDIESLTDVNQLSVTVLTLAVTLIAGTLGGVYLIAKDLRRKAKRLIDDAIYGVVPTNVPIRVPTYDFDLERKLIEARGFRTKPYKVLDHSCVKECVVVVSIKTDDDLKDFEAFLNKYEPDPKRVAYLLYTSLRLDNNLFQKFHNMTFANVPAAIGTHLFALAHGILVERPTND
jgi:hypothetical protein